MIDWINMERRRDLRRNLPAMLYFVVVQLAILYLLVNQSDLVSNRSDQRILFFVDSSAHLVYLISVFFFALNLFWREYDGGKDRIWQLTPLDGNRSVGVKLVRVLIQLAVFFLLELAMFSLHRQLTGGGLLPKSLYKIWAGADFWTVLHLILALIMQFLTVVVVCWLVQSLRRAFLFNKPGRIGLTVTLIHGVDLILAAVAYALLTLVAFKLLQLFPFYIDLNLFSLMGGEGYRFESVPFIVLWDLALDRQRMGIQGLNLISMALQLVSGLVGYAATVSLYEDHIDW